MRVKDVCAGIRVLKGALMTMNDSGLHWTKGHRRIVTDRGDHAFCSLGGIEHVLGILETDKGELGGAGRSYSCYTPRGIAAVLALGEELGARRSSFRPDSEGLHDMFRESQRMIIGFNDSELTTWEAVVDLFQRASARLDTGSVESLKQL